MKNILIKLKKWWNPEKTKKEGIFQYYNFEKCREYEKVFNSLYFDSKKFEKLEYIGDRVINLIISKILIEHYPQRVFYSCLPTIAFSNHFFEEIYQKNKFNELPMHQFASVKNKGDILECLCAIIYRKEGFEKTEKIFRKIFLPELKKQAKLIDNKNWQFMALLVSKGLKGYTFKKNKIFKSGMHTCEYVIMKDKKVVKNIYGYSPNKNDAEESASYLAYQYFMKIRKGWK